ncbi:MAG: hypothetical protein B7X57_02605 [Erythrobacter sp. 34-65-8]|nr:MAG: hypothetical protein B7X57_02605 [Erythrobacter sp. 34-65-8]
MTMTRKEQAGQHSARGGPKAKPPLDEARLRDLALAYVARFATTGKRVERYLVRKLRERGWAGEGEPDLDGLIARMGELGYIDDVAFARARGGDLLRRGYGARRVGQVLAEAGVDEPVRRAAAPDEAAARRAAFALARRKRLGPFDSHPPDPARRAKQLAAIVRAGHGFDAARAIMDARDESALAEWVAEAGDDAGNLEGMD